MFFAIAALSFPWSVCFSLVLELYWISCLQLFLGTPQGFSWSPSDFALTLPTSGWEGQFFADSFWAHLLSCPTKGAIVDMVYRQKLFPVTLIVSWVQLQAWWMNGRAKSGFLQQDWDDLLSRDWDCGEEHYAAPATLWVFGNHQCNFCHGDASSAN